MKLKLLSCALGTLGVATGMKAQKETNSRPNVIFILTDDMGYGDLGVLYQNQRAKANDRSNPWTVTPNLDKMAKEGVQMTDQYCAAPVSAPSRGSLLTGKSQGHTNIRDNQFDKALEDNYTLGNVMRSAGYATAAFGKWGLQGQDGQEPNWTAHPLNRGFDYFFGYMRHEDGHEHYPKEAPHSGRSKQVWENRVEISSNLDKCYTADLWTAAAKKWIVEHKQGSNASEPFLVFLSYDTPHAVLELPTQAYPAGGGLKGGLQWLGTPGHMINTASGTIDSWYYPEYANATYDDDQNPATPEIAWPDVYKRYATDVRRIDDAVGDIRQLLKDLKIDDNTLIVFTSDNGPSIESYLREQIKPTFFRSFGPFDGIKRDCWEGGLRVPTLACWPGHIPAGKTIKSPSISYDWMPTLTDFAGLPAPAVSDGVSLRNSLTASGEQAPSNIYVEYYEGGKTPGYTEFSPGHRGRKRGQMQMLRLGDFVGVRYNVLSANDDFEIYNVAKDPQETNNLGQNQNMKNLQQQFKDLAIQSRRPSNTALRPYDNDLLPAISIHNTKKGINWSFYDGKFPWVPQVTTLKPSNSGASATIYEALPQMNDNTVAYFDGYLRVPADGDYKFTISAGGKSVLRLHNATVIDADYEYFAGSGISGSIKLKAGLHPFRLSYLKENKKSKAVMDLKWSGPGFSNQTIPASAFEIK